MQRTGIKTLRNIINLRRQKFLAKKKPFTVLFKTTSKENYNTYGKNFIEKFKPVQIPTKDKRVFFIGKSTNYIIESPQSLAVECILEEEQKINLRKVKNVQILLKNKRPKIATIALGFEKDVLIVEAIQENSEQKKLRNEFWRKTKTRPLEKLLAEAESTAKQMGFKQIKIRRPETLYYYLYPVSEVGTEHIFKRRKEIQAGMRVTYNRLAKQNGYTKGEFYYTKQL